MESSWRDTNHGFSGAVAVTPIRNPLRSDRRQLPGGERLAASSETSNPRPAVAARVADSRVFQLSDGNRQAIEIRQRLEGDGYEVESVASVIALSELLKCLLPELILLDVSRVQDLAAVADARRDAALRAHKHHIQMVVMAEHDSLQTRLEARRAGADALLVPPFHATEVLYQVNRLLAPAAEEIPRVLIVEDNRADALFVQSILHNAGMLAQVEENPLNVLVALEALRPDLVLMDLQMPHASGVELTALIRGHPVFMGTPIVFLSGETHPEARFDAIRVGADDFLSKPIRPRHLIDSVQTRVRRMRERQQQGSTPPTPIATRGLCERAYLFDRINDALHAGATRSVAGQSAIGGGALYLEVDGATILRERFGLAVFEQLLAEAGRILGDALSEQQLVAHSSDGSFLILAMDFDDSALDVLARGLRGKLVHHTFEAGAMPLRLRAAVGICPLRFGFQDASALLDAAERACREARASASGVVRYQAPSQTKLNQEAALARQVCEAVNNNGFELIYQPIVAVQGSAEARYQTFLRMRDADGKLLAAAEVLPIAERSRIMVDIDRWVVSRVMKVQRLYRDSGQAMRLFVPQAMTTLVADDHGRWIKAELAAHQLSGSSLVLECRLEEALHNQNALLPLANALIAEDVQLCIGQFELGEDASRLLEETPLGFVKLAGKYATSNLPRELRDELRELIDLAHRFGVHVIGNRVEDAQSAATLWMSGVDFIQGNLVHPAASALDFDFHAAVL